jgi:hypothetical protein
MLLAHHPGFSCPLCRSYNDLESDVEVDVPEGYLNYARTGGGVSAAALAASVALGAPLPMTGGVAAGIRMGGIPEEEQMVFDHDLNSATPNAGSNIEQAQVQAQARSNPFIPHTPRGTNINLGLGGGGPVSIEGGSPMASVSAASQSRSPSRSQSASDGEDGEAEAEAMVTSDIERGERGQGVAMQSQRDAHYRRWNQASRIGNNGGEDEDGDEDVDPGSRVGVPPHVGGAAHHLDDVALPENGDLYPREDEGHAFPLPYRRAEEEEVEVDDGNLSDDDAEDVEPDDNDLRNLTHRQEDDEQEEDEVNAHVGSM